MPNLMAPMIPKVIHYCWFGRGKKPKLAVRCIDSWRRFFPDYELKVWNEDNFDVNIIPYTAEAYAARKWAYVSDYARMWVLYHYGGLYFDTDVEVIRRMDDIVERGPFMGIEVNANGMSPNVNPGLGLGVTPGLSLYHEILDRYEALSFRGEDGKPLQGMIVPLTTQLLIGHGLQATGELQHVAGIWIYPQDYFNPDRYTIQSLEITPRTRSIHWYGASWLSPWKRFLLRLKSRIRKIINT